MSDEKKKDQKKLNKILTDLPNLPRISQMLTSHKANIQQMSPITDAKISLKKKKEEEK